MNNIAFTPDGWSHYTEWQKKDLKIVEKINELIKEIYRNGVLAGKGKPEHLRRMQAYSRRITQEHRLVYNMNKDLGLLIYACKGHYND